MDAQSQELTPEILQQQPLLLAAILLVFGLMMVFVSGGIGSWIYFGLRAQQGQPVLPIEPWRPRLWGLADMLVILIAIFLGQTLFVSLGVTWMGIDTSEILAGGGELPLSLSLIASLGNVAALFAGALCVGGLCEGLFQTDENLCLQIQILKSSFGFGF